MHSKHDANITYVNGKVVILGVSTFGKAVVSLLLCVFGRFRTICAR